MGGRHRRYRPPRHLGSQQQAGPLRRRRGRASPRPGAEARSGSHARCRRIPHRARWVRFPGLEDVPNGWAAWGALPQEVAGQFVATLIFMEIANRDQTGNSEFEGDFRNGFIDFGWDKQTDEWKKKKRTIELNNGRAAMMGITGLMLHDALGNVSDILPF